MGELEGGARSSASDDDEDDGSREGSGGDGSGNETRGTNSARARREVKFATLFKSFYFFIYYFSRGVKSNPRYSNHVILRPDCIEKKLFNL